MSAGNVVEFVPPALRRAAVPIYASGEVSMLAFLRALKGAGLTYRYAPEHKAFIIEPKAAQEGT